MEETLYADQITLTEMLHASFDELRTAAQRERQHKLAIKVLRIKLAGAVVSILATVAVAAVKIHNETKDED